MRAPKRSLRNRGPIEAARAEPEAGPSVERLRRDLERRGMAPTLARPVAARIAARAGQLGPDAYAAFLDGVAVPPELRASAEARFRAEGLLGRRCAREVAGLEARAAEAAWRGRATSP